METSKQVVGSYRKLVLANLAIVSRGKNKGLMKCVRYDGVLTPALGETEARG